MTEIRITYKHYTHTGTTWKDDRILGSQGDAFLKLLLDGDSIAMYINEVEEIQELIDRLELMKTELAVAKTITKTNPKEEITR